MNRTSDMKKRLPGIILITGGIVLVAMVIQAVILSFINNRSFDGTFAGAVGSGQQCNREE